MIQSSKHIESVGGFGSGSFIDYSLFIHICYHIMDQKDGILLTFYKTIVDSINNL